MSCSPVRSVAVAAVAAFLACAGQAVAATPSWNVQTAPAPVQQASFASVSCPSTSWCAAVGESGGSGSPVTPLAESWGGSAWTIADTPIPTGAGEARLQGVSCTSPTACLAVGSMTLASGAIQALAERWDGSTWVVENPAVPPRATTMVLEQASCATATNCTAVGSYWVGNYQAEFALAERWDGATWTLQEPASPGLNGDNELQAISCSSVSACTAVGHTGAGAAGGSPLAERWNGLAWTQQITDPIGAGTQLLGVSCPASTACTGVGYWFDGSVHGGAWRPMVQRWNGIAWTSQQPAASTDTHAELQDVSCASTSVCVAVGGQMVERWMSESPWTAETVPPPVGASADFTTFRSVSCPKAHVCTAVGWYWTSTGQLPLVERYS
jgi:hypothetical protein